MKNAKEKLHCIIDTMQLSIPEDNFKILEIVTKENFEFIKFLRLSRDKEYYVFKLNLNKLDGYYKPITGLKEYNKSFNVSLEKIGAINESNYKLDRVDIAIDSDLSFHENFKWFLFIFELVIYGNEKSDSWFTTSLKTLDNNTIILKDSCVEVCFYDKQFESNGKHNHNSRMEWRFKRAGNKDFNVYLDRLISRLESLENNIEPLERHMANRLIRLWNREIDKGHIRNFSEFVRKYSNYFYTLEVLKMVYAATGLKGSYKNWLIRFRHNNSLIFFSKSNIKSYKKEMIRSVKKYKKP